MPTVRNVVGTIQEWATKFSEADESTKQMVVTIGAVVAAIGPAMLVVSKILKTIVSVHDTFVKLTPVVKAVMGALGGFPTSRKHSRNFKRRGTSCQKRKRSRRQTAQ